MLEAFTDIKSRKATLKARHLHTSMPHGYLKHCKEESWNNQRGGSSRSLPRRPRFDRRGRTRRARGYQQSVDHEKANVGWRDNFQAIVGVAVHEIDTGTEDESLTMWDETGPKPRNGKHAYTTEAVCAICLEFKPMVSLMKNCRHSLACYECMRETYIIQAQQDVSNYPLKCFHPSCDRIVTTNILMRQGIFETSQETQKHYRLCELAKSYRGTQRVVHCPSCDHPKHYTSGAAIKCRACHTQFVVAGKFTKPTTEETTIQAVESFQNDNKGRNDGWARCSTCKMIISKGDGCDHIRCPCGQHFYFSEWRLGHKADHLDEYNKYTEVNVENVQNAASREPVDG